MEKFNGFTNIFSYKIINSYSIAFEKIRLIKNATHKVI